MNIPLMKTSGNLTSDEIIMMLEGALDGGEDNIKPKDEKQTPPRSNPNIRIIGFVICVPIASPMAIGSIAIKIPNIKEASISPKIRVVMDMGQDINLSNVCT